jgi:hypothetical protein
LIVDAPISREESRAVRRRVYDGVIVAENDRVASISMWDGTLTQTG